MIFVANQLFNTHPQTIEQQFAACSGLSQSISEEFDRSAELQAQTVQLACESWGQFYSSLWQVKDPQEFFMLLSAQLHASAEQTQHYWHAAHSLTQQIHEKMFALEQTLSPMIKESLIDITPAAELKTINLEKKIPGKTVNRPVKATLVKAVTVPVKSANKQEVESTIAATEVKTKSKAKTETKSLQTKPMMTPDAALTPTDTVKIKRSKTLTPAIKTVEAEVAAVTATTIPTKPPSKVRQVKKTEPAETINDALVSDATISDTTISDTTTAKKSAVVGLPTKPAAKPGFPGVAGQPGYKAKSSKATGAKKRVRQ